MMSAGLSPSLPDHFRRPGPYRIIHGFLGDDLAARLLAYVQENEDAFQPTMVGKSGTTARLDDSIRVSLSLKDLGPLRGAVEQRYAAVMDWAVAELHLKPFTLDGFDMEVAAHNDGGFYKRHIDTFVGESASGDRRDRVLTGVYYFHAQPKGYVGGDLRMHALMESGTGEGCVDITPEHDMLLLFPSWMPHEVLPVSCPSKAFRDSRFAINGWYRRRPPGC